MDLSLIIALAAILFFGVLGFRDGVIKRLIEIAGVFATLYLTARFATLVAPRVMEETSLGEGGALLLTWAGLFLVGLILSRLLARFLSKMIRLTILGGLDRFGGALVGMAFGTLVVSVLLVAFSQVPGAEGVRHSFERNPAGRFIFYAAPNLYTSLRGLGGGRADDIWSRALEDTREQVGKAGDKVQDAVESTTDDIKDGVRQKVEDEIKEEVDRAGKDGTG